MKKIICFLIILLTASCSTHQQVVRTEPQIQEIKVEEQFLKRKVAIARFTNETQYAKGIFYDKNSNNPIEKQAADMLATKLASSGKFILLERQDLIGIQEELKLAGNERIQKVGADYLIIGSVTEFGRKNVGDNNVFSRSKTQTVQAGVSVRLVDVATGEIIYSEEGKGEATTTVKTVVGVGETADYDATLNDKAISVAISKLVENIINNCMNRPWKSYILSDDDNGIIISGGKSQGIKVGDIYAIEEKGKKVINPQTNMLIELPGKQIAKVKVGFTGGENPQNEFSMVSLIEGNFDKLNLTNYTVNEIKK